MTPTLAQHRVADDPGGVRRDDPLLDLLPTPHVEGFAAQLQAIYAQGGPEQAAQKRELFDRRGELVAAMAGAGVGLLAGTDTGTPYLLPGAALHEELALLVSAGLSPLQALHAATLEPARYLGREQGQGTIAAGRIADLVLLDGDPLVDITNTGRIDAVVVRGCPVDRDERGRMLAAVRTAAQDPALAAMAPVACPCCARR